MNIALVHQTSSYSHMLPGLRRGISFIIVLLLLSLSRAYSAVPANDHFTNAVELVGLPSSALGDNAGATFDTGGPLTGLGGKSVWWRWTAPFTGRAVIIDEGSAANLWCTVWTGSSLTNLSPAGANSLYYSLFLTVTQDVAYYIAVDNGDGMSSGGKVRFRVDSPPPNDNFADATVVSGPSWQVSADNSYATEEGEPFLSGWRIGTVWWKWTSPFSGPARISISGSEGNIHTWMGTGNLENLQLHSGDVQAGVTYWICAATSSGRGRIKLTMFPPTPLNDLFANRMALTNLPARLLASNIGATNEAQELRGQKGSVWWKWKAAASGRLLVSTSVEGQPWWYRADVAVFAGNDLKTLKLQGQGSPGVSIPVVAGRDYAIAVREGIRSDFYLEAQFVPFPDNDNFENRQQLTGAQVFARGNATSATSQPREPRVNKESTGASIWYTWTAPTDGWCTMEVTSTNDVFGNLSVYTGSTLSSLKRVKASLEYYGSRLRFSAQAGVTYQIQVDGHYQQRGPLDLRIVLTTLKIVTPSPSSVWSAANPVLISITADPAIDAGVTNVTLFAGRPEWSGMPVGRAESLPATILVTNLLSGDVTLFAHATLDSGEVRNSPPVQITVRPHNDDFARSQQEHAYFWEAAAHFGAATKERGEPGHIPGWGSSPSLWWSWTAPSSGETTVWFYTYGRNRAGLAIYTGANLHSLNRVQGRAEVHRDDETAFFHFSAQAGVIYHMAVVTDSGGVRRGFETEIRCSLKTSAVVANSPTDITGPTSLTFALNTSEALNTISSVDFLVNGTPLARVSEPPFAYTWSNVSCGVFDVNARINKLSGEEPPLADSVSFHVRPSNDHFTNRIVLAGVSNALDQCVSSATREPGEPVHSAPWPGASVWWSWTAPASGKLFIGEGRSPVVPYPWVNIYSGDVLTNLILVTNSAPERTYPDRIILPVTEGTTYQIAAGGKELALQMRFYPPPPNDHFSNSVPLSGSYASMSSYTVGATREAGEPLASGYSLDRSVWWHWTAPTNGYITLTNASWPSGVFVGDTVSSLQAAQTLGSGKFRVLAGRRYSIALSSYWAESENVRAEIYFTPTVANDWFENAPHLTGTNEVMVADTRGATSTPGEASIVTGLGRTLWWTWTAPAEGNVYLTADRLFDAGTLFAVYENASSEERPALATGGGFIPVKFRSVAGRTYTILVDCTSGIIPGMLQLNFIPAPPNDAIADATILPPNWPTATGTIRGASTENWEPRDPVLWAGNSVWLQWQCPQTTNVLITVSRHWLAVFQGSRAGMDSRILPQPHLDSIYFPAKAGTNYMIRISYGDGIETDMNHPGFELNIRPFEAPSNDMFANAARLSGVAGTADAENWTATTEAGEYNVGWANLKRTLWYKWESPGAGLFVATNRLTESDLTIYSLLGTNLGSLHVIGGSHNRAMTPVRPGDIVYLQTDGPYGGGGRIAVGYDFLPAPENDEFTNAFPLVGTSITFGGDPRTATGESANYSDRNRYDYHDIWWRWTAPASGTVTITNIHATGTPLVRVYTGTLSNRTLLTYSSWETERRLTTFTAVAGTDYSISATWSSNGDDIALRLDLETDEEVLFVQQSSPKVPFVIPIVGEVGTPFTVETSTNLVDWIGVFSGTLQSSRFDYVDKETPVPQRFFRIRKQISP